MISEIQHYIKKKGEAEDSPSKQTLYYLERLRRIKESPRELNWNWSAFLAGPFWMLYRRMYWQATCFFIIGMLLSLLEDYFPSREWSGAFIGLNIGQACVGNFIYYYHVKQQLKKGRSNGGIDLLTPSIVLIVYIVIVGIFIMENTTR